MRNIQFYCEDFNYGITITLKSMKQLHRKATDSLFKGISKGCIVTAKQDLDIYVFNAIKKHLSNVNFRNCRGENFYKLIDSLDITKNTYGALKYVTSNYGIQYDNKDKALKLTKILIDWVESSGENEDTDVIENAANKLINEIDKMIITRNKFRENNP